MEQSLASTGGHLLAAPFSEDSCASQPRAWALKKSLTRPSFFLYIREIRKNKATDLAVSQLRGSIIAVISAHVPLCQAHTWASAGLGPNSSSLKQWKSYGPVEIYNYVSARSPLTKFKKKIIERAAIKKRECQCTDELTQLSTTQNGRGAAERFSTYQESNPCRPTLWDQS